MSRFSLILIPAVAAGALLAACSDSAERELSQPFVAPPWTADESYAYNLVIEDNQIYGTCTLETKLGAEEGTVLNRLCSDGENRDDGSVHVEPKTLRPLFSVRVGLQPEKNQRLSFSSFYEPPIVRFVSDEDGKQRETTRELPKADATSPNPGYYDDESLLWLVRGIPLEEGYEASYQNVSAGTGQTFRVNLKVEGRETVRVPAGEFATWRVRVRTASVTQFAWVETEGSHRLIQARIKGIQDVTYKLMPPE